ncbi:MAG: pyridoxamine 5'-phosphate oxidase family protein [Oscillospiraceae bacterium]|jgi:nitroimidazol reductase NimA-like FMN-containing flavoprotein (pyridoxamine 5'-phosphate oxidase superfamily)|nr:pyridoxamine 5'-phosphate oxidase family protein [Oscillospiraceae bacterium]
MFREMRRKRQELPREEVLSILERATSGVLAVEGDEGYPYAVPMSFLYEEGKLYFHSAAAGHKLDALQRNNRASFCVIDRDLVSPEEYTTYYRSVIVFGKIRFLKGAEARGAILRLSEKYAPGNRAGLEQEIRKSAGRLCMLELSIEHMTGKEAIELVRGREAALDHNRLSSE